MSKQEYKQIKKENGRNNKKNEDLEKAGEERKKIAEKTRTWYDRVGPSERQTE